MRSSLRGVRTGVLGLALFSCLLTACGDDDASQITVSITSVVEGTLRNGLTREPIEGATLRIHGAGGAGGSDSKLEVVTDADGHYRASFAGSGRFTYTIEAEGFARVVSTITFDPNDLAVEGSSGAYTLTQLLNADLFPRTGRLRARVFGTQFRDWLSSAPFTLTFFSGIDDPSLTLTGVSDDEGTIEVGELPAGTAFTLTVRATDRDGDGVLDTTGMSQSVTLEAGVITEVFVGPVGAYNGPGILWTNMDDMRSWPIHPSFVFIFRTPMDTAASATSITLRDTNYATRIAHDLTWSSDATQLTITPGSNLVEGREYALSFSAWSALGEAINSSNYVLRVTGGADDMPALSGLQWLDDPTEQELFDTSFDLAFDAVDNVDRVRFYGRNTMRGSDWVFIQDATPDASFPKQQVTLNITGSAAALLASFPNDAITFFGRGETLEIAAALVIGGIEGPRSSPIQLRDQKCIDVELITGTNNAPDIHFDNSDGLAPKPIMIGVMGSASPINGRADYFAEDAAPSLTIDNGPLSPSNFVIDPEELTLTRRDRSTIAWTGTLAIDDNAQLDLIRVDLSALHDPSGNPACQSMLEAYTPGILGDGGEEPMRWSFESGAQGWSGSGSFVRGSTQGPTGTSTLWGTGISASRPDNVNSVLRSPRILVPASHVLYWTERRDLDDADTIQVVYVTDDDQDALERHVSLSLQDAVLPSGFARYRVNALPTQRWLRFEFRYQAGVPASGAGTTTASGFRLDDVELSGIWPRTEFYDGN